MFPIEIQVNDSDRNLAISMGGLHKLGLILLRQSIPQELHEDIFWGLSIGTIKGVGIKTETQQLYQGKIHNIPLYLDSNFEGTKIKFELR